MTLPIVEGNRLRQAIIKQEKDYHLLGGNQRKSGPTLREVEELISVVDAANTFTNVPWLRAVVLFD